MECRQAAPLGAGSSPVVHSDDHVAFPEGASQHGVSKGFVLGGGGSGLSRRHRKVPGTFWWNRSRRASARTPSMVTLSTVVTLNLLNVKRETGEVLAYRRRDRACGTRSAQSDADYRRYADCCWYARHTGHREKYCRYWFRLKRAGVTRWVSDAARPVLYRYCWVAS
jgi:hypothetical protein